MTSRPEFAQFAAERRAAEQDIRLARAERRPQVTYSINGGFVTDSLRPSPLGTHTGASATVGVSIPLFDGGASRSRERQARLSCGGSRVVTHARRAHLRATVLYGTHPSALRAQRESGTRAQASRMRKQTSTASIARYRAGEGQIIEVTDAQNALNTQRTALYQAIFDYQTALSRLRQATGQ
ncbi:MAG: TolC family protein [Pyrinomonadaceae bacterium]